MAKDTPLQFRNVAKIVRKHGLVMAHGPAATGFKDDHGQMKVCVRAALAHHYDHMRNMYKPDLAAKIGPTVTIDALEALEAGYEAYDNKYKHFKGTKNWRYVKVGERIRKAFTPGWK
jgi:hypothetical protein